MKSTPWVEKYRPATIEECILPVDLKQIFKKMAKDGDFSNLLLIGPKGIGKTSVAKALLNELDCDYVFKPCGQEGNIDSVRNDVINFASSVSFKNKRKFVIFDEADSITRAAQESLRNVTESFAENCGFILTANYANKIIDPLQSRCSTIAFDYRKEDKPKLAQEFYHRIIDILAKEACEYDKKVVVDFISKLFPDFRKIINELQNYSKYGKIDTGIFSARMSDETFRQLIEFMKAKDYTKARVFIGQEMNNDPQVFFRTFYENLNEVFTARSVPDIAVTIAKYQYYAALVVDQEVNLAAFLAEAMVQAEWK